MDSYGSRESLAPGRSLRPMPAMCRAILSTSCGIMAHSVSVAPALARSSRARSARLRSSVRKVVSQRHTSEYKLQIRCIQGRIHRLIRYMSPVVLGDMTQE
eukprot:Skav235545  [mRNA]  locus=scaffold3067:229236:229538:+ [translate_table: standard]